MTQQNKTTAQKITIGVISGLVGIIVTIATLSFNSGVEKQKIETNAKQIETCNNKKLNKETFKSFREDYKDDRDEIKAIVKDMAEKIDKIYQKL